MNWFYIPDIHDHLAFMQEDEARHCVQVLRHRIGDEIVFVDGKGGMYEGVIQDTGKKSCTVLIRSHQPDWNCRPYKVHIAIAPTKNIDRFEWFLEKATEIGVDTIIPLNCHRTERDRIRHDRLEGVLISAMKQSKQAKIPVLHELTSFSLLLRQLIPAQFNGAQKFIAWCGENVNPPFVRNYRPGNDVFILIGPEGDFTNEEVETALQSGFLPLSLGPNRLRTETAGIVACTTVHVLNEPEP